MGKKASAALCLESTCCWNITVTAMLQDSSMGKKDSAVKCLEVLSTCKPDHWKAILDAGISQLLLTQVSVLELLCSLQLLLREAFSFASVILSVIVWISIRGITHTMPTYYPCVPRNLDAKFDLIGFSGFEWRTIMLTQTHTEAINCKMVTVWQIELAKEVLPILWPDWISERGVTHSMASHTLVSHGILTPSSSQYVQWVEWNTIVLTQTHTQTHTQKLFFIYEMVIVFFCMQWVTVSIAVVRGHPCPGGPAEAGQWRDPVCGCVRSLQHLGEWRHPRRADGSPGRSHSHPAAGIPGGWHPVTCRHHPLRPGLYRRQSGQIFCTPCLLL